MTPTTLIDENLYPDPPTDQSLVTGSMASAPLQPVSPPLPDQHTTYRSLPRSTAGGKVPRYMRRVKRLPSTIPETITDLEIRQCRLLLALHDTAPLRICDQPAGALELCCDFQPTAGLRFVSAQLRLTLETPQGVRIIDLAPRRVESEGVAISVTKTGRFAIKPLGAAGKGELQHTADFKQYTCLVSGSGNSTQEARWEFNEMKQGKQGLGTQHALFLIVSAVGTLRGRIYLSAAVERSGLMGAHDQARRWLRLGALPEVPYLPLEIQVPT
ncbi:hypothetical protein [Chromohalobacter sp. 48-RD10]|uniref:hypothetical protein n=1 Tax=Chromohalobacter sp. 48-RD10 TaxID=2994063 RepID=UPI0024690750|nr:hypothetical protein [Chromohalobacter sp. 48-RD10]